MAKVKRPAALGPRQVPFAPAGVMFRDTKHGLVVQAKPVKRLNRRKPYQFYREQEFGWAGKFASNPLAIDYETAVEMVKGTTMVPRDFLTQCMFGRAYVIEGGPFTNWPNYRDVTNNPQYVLELLDPVEGAVIVRDPIGWVARPPGSEGYVLTIAGGLPEWRPGGGGGGGVPRWITPGTWASNATANNARCLRLSVLEDVTIDQVAIWYSRTSVQTLGLRIFEAAGMVLGTLVADAGNIVPPANYTGDMIWNIAPAAQLEAGKSYWLVHFEPGATLNYRLNTYTTTSYLLGLMQNADPAGGTIATNDPVSGMTVVTWSQAAAFKLRAVA